MLVHHSSRSYQEAASDAATRARGILEKRIEQGRISGQRVIEKVMSEVPKDQIVGSNAVQFTSPEVRLSLPRYQYNMHKHAFGQVCSRADFPMRFANYLQEPERAYWGKPLLANNLNELYLRMQGKKFLLRSHEDQLRGFLSDKYRRLDSRPLLEAFAGTCQEYGALPIEGYGTDTKVAMKAVLPMVFEPVEHEVLAFGIMWENSDYGNGKHQICGFVDRLWCTNYAIMTERFAQVHFGKRLSEDLTFSQRTYELDTATQASAIKDIVKSLVSPEAIEGYCEMVRASNEKKIDPTKAIAGLKKQVTIAELDDIKNKFNEPDVEELPPGNTVWRLSNAISWVAGNKTDDTERKIDLMKLAGKVLEI